MMNQREYDVIRAILLDRAVPMISWAGSREDLDFDSAIYELDGTDLAMWLEMVSVGQDPRHFIAGIDQPLVKLIERGIETGYGPVSDPRQGVLGIPGRLPG